MTHREETALRSGKTNAIISKLIFKPSKQISRLHDILPSLGIVSVDNSNVSIPPDLDIDQQGQVFVRSERSKSSLVTCFKTSKLGDGVEIGHGCFVPGNKLLLCDYNENKVYLCDHDGSNTNIINLDYKPHDVTLYDRDTALVSVRNKGIQMIDMKKLKPGKRIKIGGHCYGITSLNGKIWVNSADSTLTMIDIKGKFQNKIPTSFKPDEICLNNGGDIYCADHGRDDVYVVTPDGEERVIYNSPDLRRLFGVTVDDFGYVYVAGYWSNNIHRISIDGKQSEIILAGEDGITLPSGLSFNHETKKLMVVNHDGFEINTFKVS